MSLCFFSVAPFVVTAITFMYMFYGPDTQYSGTAEKILEGLLYSLMFTFGVWVVGLLFTTLPGEMMTLTRQVESSVQYQSFSETSPEFTVAKLGKVYVLKDNKGKVTKLSKVSKVEYRDIDNAVFEKVYYRSDSWYMRMMMSDEYTERLETDKNTLALPRKTEIVELFEDVRLVPVATKN